LLNVTRFARDSTLPLLNSTSRVSSRRFRRLGGAACSSSAAGLQSKNEL
jgi:hypothetical protein